MKNRFDASFRLNEKGSLLIVQERAQPISPDEKQALRPRFKEKRSAPQSRQTRRPDLGCTLLAQSCWTLWKYGRCSDLWRRAIRGRTVRERLPPEIRDSSNTVMAVVPDSNRISFYSTQLTTFQTVFSHIDIQLLTLYHGYFKNTT